MQDTPLNYAAFKTKTRQNINVTLGSAGDEQVDVALNKCQVTSIEEPPIGGGSDRGILVTEFAAIADEDLAPPSVELTTIDSTATYGF